MVALEKISSVSWCNTYEVNGEFLIIKDKSGLVPSNTLKGIYRLNDGTLVSEYPFAEKGIVYLHNGLLILENFNKGCFFFPFLKDMILMNLNNGKTMIQPAGSLCCTDKTRCAILIPESAEIVIFDLVTHELLASIKSPSKNVQALDLSGRLLLSLYYDSGNEFMGIWDIPSGECIKTISLERKHHTILKSFREQKLLIVGDVDYIRASQYRAENICKMSMAFFDFVDFIMYLNRLYSRFDFKMCIFQFN